MRPWRAAYEDADDEDGAFDEVVDPLPLSSDSDEDGGVTAPFEDAL